MFKHVSVTRSTSSNDEITAAEQVVIRVGQSAKKLSVMQLKKVSVDITVQAAEWKLKSDAAVIASKQNSSSEGDDSADEVWKGPALLEDLDEALCGSWIVILCVFEVSEHDYFLPLKGKLQDGAWTLVREAQLRSFGGRYSDGPSASGPQHLPTSSTSSALPEISHRSVPGAKKRARVVPMSLKMKQAGTLVKKPDGKFSFSDGMGGTVKDDVDALAIPLAVYSSMSYKHGVDEHASEAATSATAGYAKRKTELTEGAAESIEVQKAKALKDRRYMDLATKDTQEKTEKRAERGVKRRRSFEDTERKDAEAAAAAQELQKQSDEGELVLEDADEVIEQNRRAIKATEVREAQEDRSAENEAHCKERIDAHNRKMESKGELEHEESETSPVRKKARSNGDRGWMSWFARRH